MVESARSRRSEEVFSVHQPEPCSINDLKSGGITFIVPAVLAGPDPKPSDRYIELFLTNYRNRDIRDLKIVTTAEIRDRLVAASVDATFIVDDDPKVRFARMIGESRRVAPFIHESVVILDEASVAIGEGVTIYPNVVIYQDTTIGDGVVIHANSVLGFPGFGPVWDEHAAEWVMFPQMARLIIEDNVEIGACTTVQRGALQDTVIGRGCRISDHVRIGHGVTIGRDTVVTCCTEISGSVHIGERVWIGPQTSIRESLTIGDRAVIGIGSNLTRDVPAGTTVVGNPARPFLRGAR
jgi:UDP-3-O-[3-hydroxymyristoyl] glucosamine N-acyltransferase